MTARTSIIIPVYNAAGTVQRAIRSVLAQTDEDWQLIVVDDCSSDGTLQQVRMLTQHDPRFVVLQQAENSGPSAARNRGLDHAHGDFICFLDSDDELLPDALADLHGGLLNDSDIVVGVHTTQLPSGRRQPRPDSVTGSVAGPDALRLALRGRLWNFLHGKLYRASLFADVRFPQDIRRYEDLVVNGLVYALSRQVRFITTPVYVYHVAPSSLTWSQTPSLAFIQGPYAALRAGVAPTALQRVSQRDWDAFRLFLYVMTIASGMNAQTAEHATQEVIDSLRSALSRARIIRAIPANPSMALSALAILTTPRLFARFYRWHAGRTFDLTVKKSA